MADRNRGSPWREHGVEASDSNDVRVALCLIRINILGWIGPGFSANRKSMNDVFEWTRRGVVFRPSVLRPTDLILERLADD